MVGAGDEVRLVLVQSVGQVETERATASHAGVSDEGRVRSVRAVDVDDGRALTCTCWRVTAYHDVTHRDLPHHTISSSSSSATHSQLSLSHQQGRHHRVDWSGLDVYNPAVSEGVRSIDADPVSFSGAGVGRQSGLKFDSASGPSLEAPPVAPPPSVWPHLFCGAGHEKRRGEQLKWSLAFRLYIGSFPCAQLPGPVHTARLGRVCCI